MQLEQQESFRIEGPQLEVFGQIESKLPAPAKKRPAAVLAIVLAALVAVFGIGGAKLKGRQASVQALYTATNEHGSGMTGDLALRADAAANLIRLCGQVLGTDDATVQAAQAALDGWNAAAENPSSGAYGIPQSLPGSKMATHGSDWRTNPETQIRWGIDYIKGRYGTPCGAWAHSEANNWY